MFDWITKPYIKWNVIDSIICSAEVIILFVLITIIICVIAEIIEKREERKKEELWKRKIKKN